MCPYEAPPSSGVPVARERRRASEQYVRGPVVDDLADAVAFFGELSRASENWRRSHSDWTRTRSKDHP